MEEPGRSASSDDTISAGPPTGGRSRLIATILIGNLQNAVLAGSRLAVPMVGLDLGASKALVGLISALFTALPMLTSVRFGRWLDGVGTRKPITFSLAIMLAACALVASHPALAILAAAAATIGLAAVHSHMAVTRAVSGFGAVGDRARNFGYLAVGYSVFQFIGPLVAGFAYDHGGTRAAFAALGAMPLLALALLVFTRFHLFAGTVAPSKPVTAGGSFALVRERALQRWIAVYSVFSAAHTLFPFVLSLHAAEIGMPASQAGLALGAVAVGATIARAGAATLAAQLGASRLLALGLVLAAAAYGALTATHGFAALLPICLALGLSLGVGTPIATALIYGAVPDSRTNEALGIAMSLTNFLQLATPLGFGLVASAIGVAPMMWLLAGLLLGAGAASAWKP